MPATQANMNITTNQQTRPFPEPKNFLDSKK